MNLNWTNFQNPNFILIWTKKKFRGSITTRSNSAKMGSNSGSTTTIPKSKTNASKPFYEKSQLNMRWQGSVPSSNLKPKTPSDPTKKKSSKSVWITSSRSPNSTSKIHWVGRVTPDADFVLFVNIIEDDFQIHAGAMACVRKSKSKRPIAGTLVFNSFHAEPSLNTLDETISTIVHEVFHAMFFERTIFRHFPLNSEGLSAIYKNKKGTFKLRSNNFIKFAREHFNCEWKFAR